ncbi:hypothetical protein JXB22_09210 [candidate division WOR-3 bacterium]|nr:hypothetical protein [candidate division WOR-3 bacterium]
MYLILIVAQLSLADSLFAHGMYKEARVEYLREFFFYPEHRENENMRLSFAIASLHVDTLKGFRELKEMMRDIPDMSSGSRTRIARCYIDLGYTDLARTVLRDTDSTRLYGYTYMKEQNMIAARDYFFKLNDRLIVQDIDRFMDTPGKSLRTAMLLSFICPGTGEMYAGNVPLGIKNLLLNAGSIYLMYNALRQKKYIDAVLVFNFLFHRFYVGSLYNAQKTAQETNERAFDGWFDDMQNTYFQDIENP